MQNPSSTPDSPEHSPEEDFDVLYFELHRLAHQHLARGPESVLQTTALVHEAYLKLNRPGVARWASKGHFLSLAAKAMRSVLVDRARRRTSQKRGGGTKPTPFDDVEDLVVDYGQDSPAGVLAIHEALERLEADHPDLARVAEQRFFGGLTVAETAEAAQVPVSTVKLASAYVRKLLS